MQKQTISFPTIAFDLFYQLSSIRLFDKSVKLLESEMKKLNAHFEFAYYPGDHFTVWTNPTYEKDGQHFLAMRYAEWLKENPGAK